MGRKSSYHDQSGAVQKAVDAAIEAGHATIDEILETIQNLGGTMSRSAIGRYKRNADAAMEEYKRAQMIARTWSNQSQDNGDVAQLTRQLIGVAAYRAASDMTDDDEVDVGGLELMSRAVKNLAMAGKTDVEARARIREEERKEAAEDAAQAVEKAAKIQGLSRDGVAALREAIMTGLAA